MIENSNKSNLKDEKYYEVVQFFLNNYAFFNFPKTRYTLCYSLQIVIILW